MRGDGERATEKLRNIASVSAWATNGIENALTTGNWQLGTKWFAFFCYCQLQFGARESERAAAPSTAAPRQRAKQFNEKWNCSRQLEKKANRFAEGVVSRSELPLVLRLLSVPTQVHWRPRRYAASRLYDVWVDTLRSLLKAIKTQRGHLRLNLKQFSLLKSFLLLFNNAASFSPDWEALGAVWVSAKRLFPTLKVSFRTLKSVYLNTLAIQSNNKRSGHALRIKMAR